MDNDINIGLNSVVEAQQIVDFSTPSKVSLRKKGSIASSVKLFRAYTIQADEVPHQSNMWMSGENVFYIPNFFTFTIFNIVNYDEICFSGLF